jgi:TPP-dependent 2-oxoacid decarboxylase
MRYAIVKGDRVTKFDPIVFVYNNGKYEVICESHERQKNFYDILKSPKYKNFDNFLSTFSYQNVKTGEVNTNVESMLNELRARFSLSQVADQELNTEIQKNPEEDKRSNALLRISKRMRTGANER